MLKYLCFLLRQEYQDIKENVLDCFRREATEIIIYEKEDTMIVHLVSTAEKRAACGTYYPPLEKDPKRMTEDTREVTCGRCLRRMQKGEMIFTR